MVCAQDGELLPGCGALREPSLIEGEIRSMRTPAALRSRGAVRAVLDHIVAEAQRRGYRRLRLETGTLPEFMAAHRLYESVGYRFCGTFGDYKPDPHGAFMTLEFFPRVF